MADVGGRAAGDDSAVRDATRSGRAFGTLLVEDGLVALDDGGAARFELRIPAASRVAGGPIDLRLAADGLELVGRSIEWLVTTNRGWAHFVGKGWLASSGEVPFRCDLHSARAALGDGPDLIAVRIYPPGSDGTDVGPVAKLSGSLPPGSVRLGE